MKISAPLLRFVATLVAVVFAASLRAVTPEEPTPTRPPHGALSSVMAAQEAPPPRAIPAKPISDAAIAGYASVGFDQLAGFPFNSPPIQPAGNSARAPRPEVMAQIPAAIKKLDEQKITVTGFMLPTKIENGLATEFLLLNSPMMCCFGVTPSTNAWIVVKMPKGAPPIQDVPLPFYGRLHVRAQWEDGWLASVYQLDGEDPVKPRT